MAIILPMQSCKLIDDVLAVGNYMFQLRSNGSNKYVIVDVYEDLTRGSKINKYDDKPYYTLNKEMPSVFNAIRLWANFKTEMSVQEFVERMLGDDFRNYARLFRGRSGVAWAASKNPFTRAFWKSRANKS